MTNRLSCSQDPLQPRTKTGTAALKAVAFAAIFVCVFLPAIPKAEAADAPAWMHALASAPLPRHDEKTEAVLLFSEEILIVQPNGRTKEIDRTVYRILRPSGRHFGKVEVHFDGETRIAHIHGWCIPAQGKDYEVKDKDVTENGLLGLQGGELFSDHRVKVMEIPAPDPGNIIGYEVEHEDRPYVLQDEWSFQETVPVALARYTLALHGLNEQASVNGFVGHTHALIIGVLDFQPSGDGFGDQSRISLLNDVPKSVMERRQRLGRKADCQACRPLDGSYAGGHHDA